MKLTYAELLEAQLFNSATHTSEQHTIDTLETTITELREQLEDERRRIAALTTIRVAS